jgi:hypothetical protein
VKHRNSPMGMAKMLQNWSLLINGPRVCRGRRGCKAADCRKLRTELARIGRYREGAVERRRPTAETQIRGCSPPDHAPIRQTRDAGRPRNQVEIPVLPSRFPPVLLQAQPALGRAGYRAGTLAIFCCASLLTWPSRGGKNLGQNK